MIFVPNQKSFWQSFLSEYLENADILKQEKYFEDIFLPQKEFFREIWHIADKVNIAEFSIQDFPILLHTQLQGRIEEKKNEQQKVRHEYDNYEKSLKELTEIQVKGEREKVERMNVLKVLEEKIAGGDPKKLEILKIEKETIVKQQNVLNEQLPTDTITAFWKDYQESDIFDGRTSSLPEILNLQWTNNLIHHCSQQWKVIKEAVNTIEIKRKHIEQEEKHFSEQLAQLDVKKWTDSFQRFEEKRDHFEKDILHDIASLDKEILAVEEKYDALKKQLEKSENQLKDFSTHIEEQAQFPCTKIDAHCPFVKQINRKNFEQLEKQQKTIEEEKTVLKKTMKEGGFDEKVKDLKTQKNKKEKSLHDFRAEPEKFLTEFFEWLDKKKADLQKSFVEKDLESLKKNLHGIINKNTNFQQI